MGNILEEDDKNSYEDLEEIVAENFDEFNRNVGDLFLSVGDIDDGKIFFVAEDDENKFDEDDENKFDEDDEKTDIFINMILIQVLKESIFQIKLIIDLSYIQIFQELEVQIAELI